MYYVTPKRKRRIIPHSPLSPEIKAGIAMFYREARIASGGALSAVPSAPLYETALRRHKDDKVTTVLDPDDPGIIGDTWQKRAAAAADALLTNLKKNTEGVTHHA